MIQKNFLSLLLLISTGLLVTTPLYAQEDEPAAEPTAEEESSDIKDKINDLKERLATKVAELREEKKRSFYGVIKDIDDTHLTLLYRDEEIPVAVDDKTTYYSISSAGKRAGAKKDDFEAGESTVVFGTLDLDDKTVIATYLYAQQPPLINYGIVTGIDENDGSFTIDSSTGSITLDYQISTQCTMMTDDKQTRCGLSKITEGDRVFLRIKPDEKDLSRATVLRMLLAPAPEKPEPSPSPVEE